MQQRHCSSASIAGGGAATSSGSGSSLVVSASGLSMDAVETAAAVAPPEKKKLSVVEAFSFLATSKQVRCLALMALAQGISTNLLEVRICKVGQQQAHNR